MNSAKQQLLLEYCVNSADVFAICDVVLDPKHFDADLRPAVQFVKDYHRKYSAVPDVYQVVAETGVVLNEQVVTRDKVDYCVAEIEDFAKKKSILHAVGESADLIAEGNFGMIEMKLKEALAVSVKRDIGISLFDDPATILRRIAESERPLSTGYDDVDKKLFGGFVRKQLVVLSGPSGGGKSLLMNNLSLNFVEAGLTTILITLEMSQDMTYLRYASMMSGMGIAGWFTQIDTIADRVNRYHSLFGNGHGGNLFIKRLPSGSPPSAIRGVLKEFELLHGKLPDVCIVDYLDIMGSDVKVPVENVSLKDKYAAEGLREIMHDYNMIGITGSQVKKEAQEDVDVDASQMAGGQTKMNTADIWGNVMLTDEMKAAGVFGVKWVKTRTSDGRGKVSLMQFDPISLRVTNFSKPLEEEDVDQYMKLVKKQKKTPVTQQRGVKADQGNSLPTPAAKTQERMADMFAGMRDDEEQLEM